MPPGPRSMKHTYSVMAIARRHPLLFSKLVAAAERKAQ